MGRSAFVQTPSRGPGLSRQRSLSSRWAPGRRERRVAPLVTRALLSQSEFLPGHYYSSAGSLLARFYWGDPLMLD